MAHAPGELSEYLVTLDIPVEWFLIISTIIESRRRFPIRKLSEDALSRSREGIYYHGLHEIPVSARSVEEWSAAIEGMVSGGLAVIADDKYVLKHYERFYLTAAALRPEIYIAVGDVVLTEFGRSYWTRFHGSDAPPVCVWDGDGNLLSFFTTEEATRGSCPTGCGDCLFSRSNPADFTEGSLENAIDPPHRCEVKEFSFPFFLDDMHVAERGYYLKCDDYSRRSPPGSPRIF